MRMSGTIAGLAVALAAVPLQAAKVKVGAPAPDFEMRTLDGQRVTLADLKGQVVVLNFWATWCGPCKRELPLLDRAHRLWKDRGLRVFAVTTEDSLPLAALKPLTQLLSITTIRRISGPYAPIEGAVPTNFIIDRAGTVRYAKAAAFDIDGLNSEVGKLLDEPEYPEPRSLLKPPRLFAPLE